MIRILRLGWMVLVVAGGGAVSILALLSNDPAGAAVVGGIALVAALATMLFTGETPAGKPKGFEPHRRR